MCDLHALGHKKGNEKKQITIHREEGFEIIEKEEDIGFEDDNESD